MPEFCEHGNPIDPNKPASCEECMAQLNSDLWDIAQEFLDGMAE